MKLTKYTRIIDILHWAVYNFVIPAKSITEWRGSTEWFSGKKCNPLIFEGCPELSRLFGM